MRRKNKILSITLILAFIFTYIPLNVFAAEKTENSFEKFIGHGFEVEFKVISDWGSGFNGKIILINTGEEMIENWSLTFDFEHKIVNSWSADVVEHEGSRYVIKNKGWNADIDVGQRMEIGFSGNHGNVSSTPQNYILKHIVLDGNSDALDVPEPVYDGETNGFMYTLFSGSETAPLQINSSNTSIKGDIHSNNNFKFNGSKLSVDGTCQTVGIIDTKGPQVSISNRIENASVIPDFRPL